MSWARLLWFDLTRGLPAALGALRRRLGWRRLARLLPLFLWRSVFTADPLVALGPVRGADATAARRERFARHQLRPVLLLEGALRDALGLDAAAALEVAGAVVAASGARFLAFNVPRVERASWAAAPDAERRTVVARVLARMFNAEAAVRAVGADAFAFDVTACAFARMARALGRPEIAALYCAADGAWFDEPRSPIALARAGTIARGATVCDFHFTFKDAPKGGGSGG